MNETNKKSGLGNFLTGFFTETVTKEKEPVRPTEPSSNAKNIATILGGQNHHTSPDYSKPTYNDSSAGNVDQEVLAQIVQRLDQEDIPGPDFLELFKAVRQMVDEGITMTDAIKSAYITLKTTNANKITKKVIDESFAFYLNVIDREKNEFEGAYGGAISQLINEPKKKIQLFESENQEIDRKIKELQTKKEQNLNQIQATNQEITSSTAKLESKKKDYSFTLNFFIESFREVYNNTSNLK